VPRRLLQRTVGCHKAVVDMKLIFLILVVVGYLLYKRHKVDSLIPDLSASKSKKEVKTLFMDDISWDFSSPRFESLDTFKGELIKYHTDLDVELNCNLDDIITDLHEIQIGYRRPDEDGDDYEEADILLTTNNNAGFSSVELLYKLHNGICTELEDCDHIFFEGLIKSNPENSMDNHFWLNQGS